MYIDLVLIKHGEYSKPYLFKACGRSGLKVGDGVIVETERGEQVGEVLGICTLNPNNDPDMVSILCKSTGASLPLKRVLKKIIYKEIPYDE